jgi:hypothetical protein
MTGVRRHLVHFEIKRDRGWDDSNRHAPLLWVSRAAEWSCWLWMLDCVPQHDMWGTIRALSVNIASTVISSRNNKVAVAQKRADKPLFLLPSILRVETQLCYVHRKNLLLMSIALCPSAVVISSPVLPLHSINVEFSCPLLCIVLCCHLPVIHTFKKRDNLSWIKQKKQTMLNLLSIIYVV